MNINHQYADISALATTMRQLLEAAACSRPLMDLAEHAEALSEHAGELLAVVRFLQDHPEPLWDYVHVTGWATAVSLEGLGQAQVPDTVPVSWVSDQGTTGQDGDL